MLSTNQYTQLRLTIENLTSTINNFMGGAGFIIDNDTDTQDFLNEEFDECTELLKDLRAEMIELESSQIFDNEILLLKLSNIKAGLIEVTNKIGIVKKVLATL